MLNCNNFLGYALIQIPDLLLFVYNYLESRLCTASYVTNQSGMTQRHTGNTHLPLDKSENEIANSDGELCGFRGKGKLMASIPPGNLSPKIQSQSNVKISKMKKDLDEVIC